MKKHVAILLVILSLMVSGLACKKGDDLSGPEWDRYFGCLQIQEEWGTTKSEGREVCKQYRP